MERDEFYAFMCARFSNSFQNWDVTQGGILRFVFTAAGAAASLLLHQDTGVKAGITGVRHWKVALGGKRKP
jgi:hypothetical protein